MAHAIIAVTLLVKGSQASGAPLTVQHGSDNEEISIGGSNIMLPQQGQAVAGTQLDVPIVPGPKDNTIRAARAALLFAIIAAILLVGTYLMDAQFSLLGLDYSLRYPLSYLGFSLVGICGLSAIVIGILALLASRRIQPRPGRAIILARRAIALGIIEVWLAILSALVQYALRDLHM
jgi:hypothetical protein